MQQFFSGIFLSIIQGVGEFLPISSSAHLNIAQQFLKVANFDEIRFFAESACFLVVLVYFRDIIFKNLCSIFSKKAAIHFFLKVLVATLPILLYSPFIGLSTYNIPLFIIMGSILMIIAEIYHKKHLKKKKINNIESISYLHAFLVGMFQGLSIFSGFSRSGSTISGGILCGFSKKAAVEFSFLISLPITFVVLIKEYLAINPTFDTQHNIYFLITFFVALFAIKPCFYVISRISLIWFAIYRIIFAICIILYFS